VTLLYFAYGSNLCLRRLKSRVPGAEVAGRAALGGFDLQWNKRSVDGSAKCNIAPSPRRDAAVHGVLIQLQMGERALLDRIEEGYREYAIAVEMGGESLSAFTYVARRSRIDDSLKPYSWYRPLVLAGAEALALPSDYVTRLREVEAIRDPDTERERRNRACLPCGGWDT